jgi:hypothetical protein
MPCEAMRWPCLFLAKRFFSLLVRKSMLGAGAGAGEEGVEGVFMLQCSE